MLRIKLVKIGRKDRPTWKVVVIEKTKTGKGLANDYIGSYNPHSSPKGFILDVEKYNEWVSKGAQPTDMVKRLKGKFIDKTKDYQKEVPTKIYKKKKTKEEGKVVPAPKTEAEAPAEEDTKEASKIEEPKEEKKEDAETEKEAKE